MQHKWDEISVLEKNGIISSSFSAYQRNLTVSETQAKIQESARNSKKLYSLLKCWRSEQKYKNIYQSRVLFMKKLRICGCVSFSLVDIIFVIQFFLIITFWQIVALSKYDINLNIMLQDFEAKVLNSENRTICDIWIPILQIWQCLKIKSWHFDVAHSYFPASACSAPFNSINTKSFHHPPNLF